MGPRINPDLQKERDSATFNVPTLTNILDGGQERTAGRHRLEAVFASETDIAKWYNLSREDKYKECMKVFTDTITNPKTKALYEENPQWYIRPRHLLSPLFLHHTLFARTMESQSSPEQWTRWEPKIKSLEIIGAYAQTELGHGTHLRKLETTAIFDPNTDEFVLHSPTLTATKWWPGGMGKTATHAVVMATLYIKGINCGLQIFLVQIRSLEDHSILSGITVGDIGPKFGADTVDNGYLRFDHVRIPRENMLMRYTKVGKDGTLTQQAHDSQQLKYGTMLEMRLRITMEGSTKILAEACTVATRFSCVRRQSELQPGSLEPQELEFQTQQYKLLPLIATCYAQWLTALAVEKAAREYIGQIEQGDLSHLPELHSISSGLKALCTTASLWGIEQCRLACGSHGYSLASGIPTYYGTCNAFYTSEGDNTVMYLQTARYLMKTYASAQRGRTVGGSVTYLNDTNRRKCQISAEMTPASLVEAYRHVAARLVAKSARQLAHLQTLGKPQYQAWDETSVQLVAAAEAHCHFFVVNTFAEEIDGIKDAAIKQVLTQLLQLYACDGIVKNAAHFLEDGFLTKQQFEVVNESVMTLLAALRPNAVALVDAFDFSDKFLCSILGRYDGNVYENLYEWAKGSALNESEVHDSYYKYLRPLMEEAKSKL